MKAYRIPVGDRYAKGKAIVNLLPRLEEGEAIRAMIPVHEFDEQYHVIFVSLKGTVKKTPLLAYSHPRENGIWAIKLAEDDELVDAKLTDGDKEILIATANGKANRFNEREARDMGRYTHGVRGIRLKPGDKVCGLAVVEPESILLSITENGYGKRSLVENYRHTHRGSQGVINIKTDERNGKVVSVLEVDEDNELLVTSLNGLVIRMPVEGIRVIGRATKGVRVMNLNEGDKVVAVAQLVRDEEEEELLEESRAETEHDDDKASKEGQAQTTDKGSTPVEEIENDTDEDHDTDAEKDSEGTIEEIEEFEELDEKNGIDDDDIDNE